MYVMWHFSVCFVWFCLYAAVIHFTPQMETPIRDINAQRVRQCTPVEANPAVVVGASAIVINFFPTLYYILQS